MKLQFFYKHGNGSMVPSDIWTYGTAAAMYNDADKMLDGCEWDLMLVEEDGVETTYVFMDDGHKFRWSARDKGVSWMKFDETQRTSEGPIP